MSSPITLSGFNNIDFGSIVTALMQQASQPLTALQTSQSNLKSKLTAFSTLGSRMSALESAAAGLSDQSSLTSLSATSSDASALGVSTSSGAQAGHYDVVVNELARAQVTVSTSSAPNADTSIVASGGTLTIGGVTVTVSGPTTLQGLADTINGTTNIGVTASVMRTATGTYRLALTSHNSGLASAFTITNGLSGGSGVAFGGNAVDASDASLTVNNIAVTSSSNTITNLVPGLTVTAYKKDPGTTIAVDVAPDSTSLKTKVQAFVSAYNSLVQFDADQRKAAANGDATSIGNEPVLRELRTSLRSSILGQVSGGGALTRLSQAGIEFTQTGTLQINDALFDAAVSSHGTDLTALFAGGSGAFPAIGDLLDHYSASSGFVYETTRGLNTQISRMDDQIADMQDRLAVQKLALQQEFSAADEAISRLNNQSSALSNFSSSLSTKL